MTVSPNLSHYLYIVLLFTTTTYDFPSMCHMMHATRAHGIMAEGFRQDCMDHWFDLCGYLWLSINTNYLDLTPWHQGLCQGMLQRVDSLMPTTPHAQHTMSPCFWLDSARISSIMAWSWMVWQVSVSNWKATGSLPWPLLMISGSIFVRSPGMMTLKRLVGHGGTAPTKNGGRQRVSDI